VSFVPSEDPKYGFRPSPLVWQRLHAVSIAPLARCISCLSPEGKTVPTGDMLLVKSPWHVEQFPLPLDGFL